MSGPEYEHLEQRLTQALQSYTTTIEPAPDAWATLERRITRRRVWQWPVLTVASAALAAALIAAVVLVTRDNGAPTRHIRTEQTPPVPTPAPTTPSPTQPVPSTTPTTVATAPSTQIVVARKNGAIELLDASNHAVRTLAILGPSYGQISRVAVDPGLTTLWAVGAFSTNPCGHLYRVDIPTRAVHEIGTVSDFALSPDGSSYATSSFVAAGNNDDCTPVPGASVVMRDAHTDAVRYWWTPTSSEGFGYPPSAAHLVWSPDGTRLAANLCWEGCDVAVVAVPANGSGKLGVFDGVRPQFFGFLDTPVWTNDHQLLAIGTRASYENPGPIQARLFDAASGAQVGEVEGLGAALRPGSWVQRAPDGYLIEQPDGRLQRFTDGRTTEVTTTVAAFTMVKAGGS